LLRLSAKTAFLPTASCGVSSGESNEAKNVLAGLAEVGVDLDAITEQLQKDGVKAFVDSLDQLLAALEKKMKGLAR
jgi:transaldolase